jgi:hypothetical protein
LASSTSKKVVVHRFDRPAVAGFLDPGTGIRAGMVELLKPEGEVASIPLGEVKIVCFVKDFQGSPPAREQRIFRSRPKTEGLWIRCQFRDNDFLEGIIPNNLLAIEAAGVAFVPPDPAANNQRIFAPREALKQCLVMGVIGSLAAKSRKPAAEEEKKQIGLFD